jgi:eukaryotic-like serine/threonine-protein kinase
VGSARWTSSLLPGCREWHVKDGGGLPVQPLQAEDPDVLGAYRLLARLGAGGMGRVYLARSPGGRAVAVKVVRPELAEDAEFRSRFRHEVDIARAVSGPCTAPVVDADTDSALPWLGQPRTYSAPLSTM